jgi:hypothetical protein
VGGRGREFEIQNFEISTFRRGGRPGGGASKFRNFELAPLPARGHPPGVGRVRISKFRNLDFDGPGGRFEVSKIRNFEFATPTSGSPSRGAGGDFEFRILDFDCLAGGGRGMH